MEYMAGQDDKISWLHSEVESWTQQGVISAPQAQSIKALYPQPQIKKSQPWALIIFSAIGAVIIGLGIILLFAYNWDKMSKYAKLSVVFGSLILAHLTGITLFLRSQRFKAIGEALCLLGTMLFGAGIWLVAQIYHIEEHYPNAFLLWAIGAMLLAWTMPSVMQAILASVLLTIWAACESVEFSSSMPVVFALLIAMVPVAYAKCSKLLLTILIISFSLSMIFVVASSKEGMVTFPTLLGVFAALVAIGLIHQKIKKYEFFSPYYFFLGLAGYIITMYVLAFPDILKEVMEIKLTFDIGLLLYWFVPAVVALLSWLFIFKSVLKKDLFRFYSPDLFLVPLMPFFILYCTCTIARFFHWPLTGVINLVLLAHIVMMMARGCVKSYLVPTIIGSLLLIALMIARFTDFFDNLANRGFVFITVGILIFSQSFFYIKFKKKKVLQENV